ncbi:hypothetical protein ACFQVA_12585 [Actinomadura keratinilytica]
MARAVWRLMAESRHAGLRRAAEAQRGLATAAAGPDPVRAVLTRLAALLDGYAVLLGPTGEILVAGGRGARRSRPRPARRPRHQAPPGPCHPSRPRLGHGDGGPRPHRGVRADRHRRPRPGHGLPGGHRGRTGPRPDRRRPPLPPHRRPARRLLGGPHLGAGGAPARRRARHGRRLPLHRPVDGGPRPPLPARRPGRRPGRLRTRHGPGLPLVGTGPDADTVRVLLPAAPNPPRNAAGPWAPPPPPETRRTSPPPTPARPAPWPAPAPPTAPWSATGRTPPRALPHWSTRPTPRRTPANCWPRSTAPRNSPKPSAPGSPSTAAGTGPPPP